MKTYLTLLVLIPLLVIVWFSSKSESLILPILNPNDIDPNLVDTAAVGIFNNHQIPKFTFKNQLGDIITQDEFVNKIYITNFFFTTCPSICPTLMKYTKLIHDEFIEDNDILLISHTVNPEIDSVNVLQSYSELHGINSNKWHLVTGRKQDIYDISRKGYFAISYNPSREEDAFIHTENVILIDKKRQIRGIYNGTKLHDMKRLIEDIYTLKKEYSDNIF